LPPQEKGFRVCFTNPEMRGFQGLFLQTPRYR
jgi:hypothetical protein